MRLAEGRRLLAEVIVDRVEARPNPVAVPGLGSAPGEVSVVPTHVGAERPLRIGHAERDGAAGGEHPEPIGEHLLDLAGIGEVLEDVFGIYLGARGVGERQGTADVEVEIGARPEVDIDPSGARLGAAAEVQAEQPRGVQPARPTDAVQLLQRHVGLLYRPTERGSDGVRHHALQRLQRQRTESDAEPLAAITHDHSPRAHPSRVRSRRILRSTG